MKMEAPWSFETSGTTRPKTWHLIPEDFSLQVRNMMKGLYTERETEEEYDDDDDDDDDDDE
jgi:hypothetical protein